MITIALASFKEAFRKKIFLLVGLLTLVYLTLFGLITYYALKDTLRNDPNIFSVFTLGSMFVSVLGLYFSSMIVAFLTIMISLGAVSSEIESGIIHAVVTRPIKRTEYVLGKYLGLAIFMTVYASFLYMSILGICAAIKLPLIGSLGAVPMLKGLLYFVMQPLAILSLCIFGSVSYKTLTNGIVVISLYILGLLGGMMEQFGFFLKIESLFKIGILSSLISPFDTIYRLMLSCIFKTVGITNPMFSPGSPSGPVPSMWMKVYIFVYAVGLLVWGVRRFNRKDIS